LRAEYIIRLDDACPTMDRHRWSEVETLLMQRGVKPIVAIVPANADPALVRGTGNGRFWEQAQGWVRAGWLIALHGYSHTLTRSKPGIVPTSKMSEFVGMPLDEQKRRIRDGVKMLQQHGVTPQAWVAPAHGMDKNTLEALRAESAIRLISDSFARRPVKRWGFSWIPQQLWRPRSMPGGLWTICLHPNEMTRADIALLSSFMDVHQGAFPDPRTAAERAVPRALRDTIFEAAFTAGIRARRVFTSIQRKKR
jgi:Uncharacterized protein conserved in bacteria (DUF2334)